MKYEFRKGISTDEARLQKLGLISYGVFENVLTEENWRKLKSDLEAEKLYKELLTVSTCFVCERSKEIIGMAFLIPTRNPTDIFQADWSYIRMVGVHPNFTGQGIGKKLIQLCIDHAKANNEHTVALHTSEFMNAARHIYEALGFKQQKELTPRLGKRYWLYKLDL